MIRTALRVALLVVLAPELARADGGAIRGVVEVNRPSGVPAGIVLVYVVGFKEPAPKDAVVVKQIERRFVPDLVAVTVCGSVAFPNGDPLLHNVFSPTTAREFDLGSFPQGDSRSRSFPRLGVLDVYCNIHPEMNATLVVLPNTKFATTDATGKFEIRNVPAGKWSVFAYSRRAEKPVTIEVTVPASGTAEVKLKLDEVQREFKHKNKYGEAYRETAIYAPGS